MQIIADSRLKNVTYEKAPFATATEYIFVFVSIHDGGRSNIRMRWPEIQKREPLR
jgi:hypothetical protein